MTTQYNIPSVSKGVNGYGLRFPDTAYGVELVASTDTSLTVPGNGAMGSTGIDRYIARFTYETFGAVWVSLNEPAALPVGAAFTEIGAILSPDGRQVKAGDVLHFITAIAGGTYVSVEFQAIQE